MSTNLVIGYPHIPNLATSFSVVGGGAATRFPVNNLFGGNKIDMFRFDGDSYTAPYLKFTVPTATSVNFLYIGRAKYLGNGCNRIDLLGNTSDNVSTATTVHSNSSFETATLAGPAAEDYIVSFTDSAPYTNWYMKYASASPFAFPHSKLFFGTAFDPGIDPNAPASITCLKVGGAQRRATFTFQFAWNGMRYSKAVEMYQTFFKTRRYQPIVLFTRDWHDILMGNQVIFCRITSLSLPPRITDYCNVTATFEELP